MMSKVFKWRCEKEHLSSFKGNILCGEKIIRHLSAGFTSSLVLNENICLLFFSQKINVFNKRMKNVTIQSEHLS